MRWPPYQHVFFDCDSTLSTVEGIDILAEVSGKEEEVIALTKAAMEGKIGLEDVYAKRLAAIIPTREQIRLIRRAYKETIVPEADAMIAALQYLSHDVYIISGGLYDPVAEFGVHLGVPRDRIRAVKIEYDQLSGRWWEKGNGDELEYLSYDHGPLTISDGKAQIVEELRGDQKGRSLLIGDGNSDFRASRAVELFVGFGGVESRKSVREKAPVFLHSKSLAPLLALVVGPAGMAQLADTPHAPLMEKACKLIDQGAITFTDERLSEKFTTAYQAVYSRTR